MRPISVLLPFERGDLVSMIHERGLIEEESYEHGGTRIVGQVPGYLEAQLSTYRTSSPRR